MRRQTEYGKGDATRPSGLPWEVKGLRFDRSLGHITTRQYNARIQAAWARARKRGWNGPKDPEEV